MTKDIRLLTADEIDVRVAQTNCYDGVVKVSLLLYKDARVDMKILDEVYGPMNWQRTHQLIGDRLYCTIEVWDDEKGCWIAKQDVGTESNTEPEKGQASDAFKRAGFNWSIGRELYTAPKIQVALNPKEYRETGGRYQIWQTFRVQRIDYDEARNICCLVIVDRDGVTRYDLGAKSGRQTSKRVNSPAPASRAGNGPSTGKVDPADVPLPAGVTDEAYWKIVSAYADGVRPKTADFADYRDAYIKKYNPDAQQVAKFDHDAENCRLARNSARK